MGNCLLEKNSGGVNRMLLVYSSVVTSGRFFLQ